MNADVVRQAKTTIAEARRMIDMHLEQYALGLGWLEADTKHADGSMTWRDGNHYTQTVISQWNPRGDLACQCKLVIDAAERVCDAIMDRDKGSKDTYRDMLGSEKHEALRQEVLAAYEHLRDVNRRYDALRGQYGLPTFYDEHGNEKPSND